MSSFQELFDQIKSSSSEDSKLQGMVESLEKMLRDSESRNQVSKMTRDMILAAITDILREERCLRLNKINGVRQRFQYPFVFMFK